MRHNKVSPSTDLRPALLLGTALLASAAASLAWAGNDPIGSDDPKGFQSFQQDSCDPLLVGVLTNGGYENADLQRLYQVAYGSSVEQACGLAKGSFEMVDPVQPPPVIPPTDLVDNVPVLPPLDPIDLPEPTDLTETKVGRTSALYLALKGAYLFPRDSVVTHTDTVVVTDTTDDVNATFTPTSGNGYGGSGALGYRIALGEGFARSLRGEAQGSYYRLNLDDVDLTTASDTGGAITQITDGSTVATTACTAPPCSYNLISEGQETVIGGFANLYLDLGLFDLPLRPYVGGGVGYGQRKTQFLVSDAAAAPAADPVSFTQELSTNGVLYQAMAGVGFDINDNLGLELGYKFLRLPAHEAAAQVDGDTADTFSMDKRDVHMVEAGITFSF